MTGQSSSAGRTALGVIDLQPTFMPGGELPVEGGEAIVPAINRLLALPDLLCFATQDWHPPGHSSFASVHPGHAAFSTIETSYGEQTLWPDHALQGSANAALHPDLDAARLSLILRKGMNPMLDSYSAFRENDGTTTTGLAAWLHAHNVETLLLAGLALDFCVGWTAEDAVAAGFKVTVIEDACRAIDRPHPSADPALGSLAAMRRRLTALGVSLAREPDRHN